MKTLLASVLACGVAFALHKEPLLYDHVGHLAYMHRATEPTVEYHGPDHVNGYCDVDGNTVTCENGWAGGVFYTILEDGKQGTIVEMPQQLGPDPIRDLINLPLSVPDEQRTFHYRLTVFRFLDTETSVYCVPVPVLDKHGAVKKNREVCYGMGWNRQ